MELPVHRFMKIESQPTYKYLLMRLRLVAVQYSISASGRVEPTDQSPIDKKKIPCIYNDQRGWAGDANYVTITLFFLI